MLQQLLRLSNDGRRVYMTVIPKADENTPQIEKKHIVEWLIDHKVASFFRFEETITKIQVCSYYMFLIWYKCGEN